MLYLFGKELKYSGALALVLVLIATVKVFLTVCYLVSGVEGFVTHDISITALATLLGFLGIGLSIWESKKALDELELED